MEFKHYTTEEFLMDDSFLNYCLGTNAKDAAEWEKWIAAHPDKKEDVEQAKELFFIMNGNRVNTNDALSRFKMEFYAHSEALESKRSANRSRITTYLVAASTVLVMVFGYLFLSPFGKSKKEIVYLTYTSPIGKRTSVELPDHSTVLLNSNTSIKVPSNYGDEDRQLILSGEAFFSVQKNKEKPFIVKSGELATTALGTSFRIRAYPHETERNVMLVTGKVKVEELNQQGRATDRKQFLVPGEQVCYSKNGNILRKDRFELAEFNKWKAEELELNDTTFDEVINKLNEWYGVDIKVELKKPNKKHFTAQFKADKIENVLNIFCFSAGCNFTIANSEITITN